MALFSYAQALFGHSVGLSTLRCSHGHGADLLGAGRPGKGCTTPLLAEITWADPGPRQRADDVERFGPFQFVAEKRGADLA